MREIALATGLKNEGIINFIRNNVRTRMDFCKTIVTTYSDNNFNFLLFACDENFVEQCENVLRDIIIEYIEGIYKVNFLKNKIKNPLKDNLAFNAYIKVLSIFDKATDETALKQIIFFNQTFFIDSFLEFRLAPLKQHWDNLATLSSDNLVMFNSGTFLDLIRYLINTMDSEIYKVKVVCKDNNFSIYNMKNKDAKVKKIADCCDAVDLITNVLNLVPSYVDVYLNEDQVDEAVNFLSNVFTNRLKIHMKNC